MPDIFKESFIGEDNVIPWKDDELLFGKYFTPVQCKYKEDIKLSSFKPIYSETPDNRDASTFLDSFIKILISEGCNEKCSYCTERLAFPPYKSFPLQELVKEAKRRITETGINIIALMADSPGEYGCETGKENIIFLINSLCAINENVKIVLHNMNPAFFLLHYEGFKSLILADKIYHLNLPIQSANDRILSLMERRYTKKDLNYMFDSIKDWGLKKYDTHIIAGFPSESDEEFNETIDFLCDKKPAYVLASPCLIVSSASANKISDKISDDEKQKRLERLDVKLSEAGIIVNTPYNSLSQRRIKDINGRER